MNSNNDRILSVATPRDLYYIVNNERTPLPDWCFSLLDLGKQLAMIEATVARSVIALAVPTRAFSSVLIATGIVIANSTKQLDSLTKNKHLKDISSLKFGTNVIYRDSKREFRGKVSGYHEDDVEKFIELKIGLKEKRSFRLRDHAAYITVSDREIKLRNYQNGKSVKSPGEFLKSCLGDIGAREVMTTTKFECLIIGQLSVIQSEIVETQIIFDNGQSRATGYLQEILRVKQFLNPDQAYRCKVIPSSYAETYEEIKDSYPPIVIFDSAHAFIKHSHNWLNTHCVVILDRTERSFAEAVALLNQNYINRVEH